MWSRVTDWLRGRLPAYRWLLLASLVLNLVLAGFALHQRARHFVKRLFYPPPPGVPYGQLPAREKFKEHRLVPGTTVFLGDSITAEAQLGELFAGVLNRGVPGNTTEHLLERLDEVTARRPSRLYLLIGVNDLLRGLTPEEVSATVATLLTRVQNETPETRVTLVSALPIREGSVRGLENRTIRDYNRRLSNLARERGLAFVDAFDALVDTSGQLRTEFTYDGIHLRPKGYWALRDLLAPGAGGGAALPR